jgi:hypothetical protein
VFGKDSLKASIAIDKDAELVECPCLGCNTKVHLRTSPKQPLASPEFYCARDHIYIARSTFEYEDKFENLLWKDAADRSLLARIGEGKQDDRMARETSEDAVTWNVFRYLETSGLLGPWLSNLTGSHASSVGKASLIYWSYCDEPGVRGVWPGLANARKTFNERPAHPSEPDLIVDTDVGVFWIEAKLTASNKTTPSSDAKPDAYKAGGDSWYKTVIATTFADLAIEKKRYEMLRYWLLGTWAAAQINKPFYLVSLVRKKSEENMAIKLEPDFHQEPTRRVLSTTWEGIYGFLEDPTRRTSQTDKLLTYMENKTAGYKAVKSKGAGNGVRGELQLAFEL